MRVRSNLSLLAGLAAVLAAACGGSSGTEPPPPPPEVGTVRGAVSADGQGVAGVALQLTRTGMTTRSATSNAAGEFEFTQVATGSWTLGVTAPAGFTVVGASSAPVTVAANQTATANFQLAAATGPGPTVTTITIGDNTFTPNDVTVPVGRLVRWHNAGSLEHNSTGAGGAWSSGNLAPGANFERTFSQAGVFPYDCTLHPGMSGTIRVQ